MAKTTVDAGSRAAARVELDAFDRAVESALTHCDNVVWLGEQSPLAAPYFLGNALDAVTPRAATAQARGERLALLLHECAASLDDELNVLLQTAWLARKPAHDNIAVAMALNMSERTFYRMRNLAIKSLAQALHKAVKPSVRMEHPVAGLTLGRAALLARAATLLDAGQSLYLWGPSGVGKSTAAAALVNHWQADGVRRAFWYTLRDDFNDHIISLHFALAWFLQTAGAGNSWRQLVADRTIVDFERTLSLLRFDLASLPHGRLLFCIDDVDLLRAERAEHAQIIHMLELLRTEAPLLLLGQRVILDADETLMLAGLDAEATAALFVAVGALPPSPESAAALVQGTRGNPALLRLVAALARAGDDPLAVLTELGLAPTIEAIFQRIWRRMDDAERALAMQLAVFRSPAPTDAWADNRATLERLAARGLLLDDGQGGVALQPHLQPLVNERIAAEARPHLHSRAADIRALRAEYTRAVEHAIAARQPAHAVWLWFANRDGEIDRGEGARALQLLRSIPLDDLPDVNDRTALQLARAELLQLAGRGDDALADLRQITTTAVPAGVAAFVRLQTAQAEEMAGQVEQALTSYRSALAGFTGLPAKHEVIAHLRLSFLHMYRRHEAPAARREALLARAKADAFLGDLETTAGRYENALTLLHAAEAAVDEEDDLATRGRICHYLSVVYGRLGDYARTLTYLDQSIACDKQRGDEVGALYSKLNRAWVLNELGRAAESEQAARAALHNAETVRSSYLVAGLAAGVAEACWAQGKWEEAEHFSLYSLEQEEIFFRAEACVVLACVRAQQARHAEASQLFAAAVEHAREIDDRAIEAYAWREWGRSALQTNNGPDGEDALARAAQIYGELGLTHALAAVTALRAQNARATDP